MSGPVQPPLTVETVDGATVGRPITKIKVSNGDLTISGNVATIDTSGGGGGTGTVTSVSSSQAFITITNPTTTPSISIGNASGAATGVLTAANFNTFDAKQDAITLTTTGTSGAATFAGGTLNIPQYSGTTGTVTSVGLTETGTALTITGSPVTGSGTFNIAGAGTSSQVILGDLSLGTLTSGTVTGTGSANQVSYWTAASVQAGSTGLTYDPSTGNLTVGGYVETGTKVTTPSGTNLELTTGSASSGSIVIADGANGQISISPNGSGKIKLDGVQLDNSAIATGYVLKATSTTEAEWSAESGGGGGGIDPLSFSTSQGLAVTAYWLLGLNPAYGSAFDFQAYITSYSGFLVKFQPPFTGTSGLYFYTSVASASANNYLWIYEESATGYAGTFVAKILLPTSTTGGQSVTQWLDAAGSNITSPTFSQGDTYIAVLEIGSSFTASSGRQGNIPFVTIATVGAFSSPNAEIFNQRYTGTIDSSLPDSEINFFSSAIGWPMLGLSL